MRELWIALADYGEAVVERTSRSYTSAHITGFALGFVWAILIGIALLNVLMVWR